MGKQEPVRDTMRDYSGPTVRIILEVPADAYHLEFTAKTIDQNEEQHVYTGRMGLADIRQARTDFLEKHDQFFMITGKAAEAIERR